MSDWLKVKEFAELEGISERAVRLRKERGQIKAFRYVEGNKGRGGKELEIHSSELSKELDSPVKHGNDDYTVQQEKPIEHNALPSLPVTSAGSLPPEQGLCHAPALIKAGDSPDSTALPVNLGQSPINDDDRKTALARLDLVRAWESYRTAHPGLGKCIGYAHPGQSMRKLFARNKTVLEPHLFSVTVTLKSGRGRPSFFYDKGGIVKAFMLAGTPQSKELGPKIIDYLEQLEAIRLERIETYWFGKRPWWPEVRDRVMKGETFQQIGKEMGRSAASVRNAVSRMIEVGILQPLRAAQALTGRAKRTVIGYGRKYYGDNRQQALPFDAQPA
jgi:hypothetical protein